MRWKLVICGLLFLFVGSYLDSVRGPLLPELNRVLSLSYGESSWFIVAGNFASVLSTFLLIPLVPRLGTRRIGMGICLLGVLATSSALLVRDFPRLLGLAVLVGSSVAASGAICNLMVIEGTDLRTRSRAMCALHTMYGFGSLISPFVAGEVLSHGGAWWGALLVSTPCFAGIALFCARGVPAGRMITRAASPFERLTGPQWLFILVFVIYVAAEVLTSTWMVPYLVEVRRLGIAPSTRYLSGFFLMMGLSRLLCFLSLSTRLETLVLFGSLVLSGLFFALGHAGIGWAFPLCGVLGPFFPLFLSRMTRRFPAEAERLTLWMLTAVQLCLALSHLLVGRLADRMGIERTYLLPLVLLAGTLVCLWIYLRRERKVASPHATGVGAFPAG